MSNSFLFSMMFLLIVFAVRTTEGFTFSFGTPFACRQHTKLHTMNSYNTRRFRGNCYTLPMSKNSNEGSGNFYKGMNAYQILEVSQTADKKEIKNAFRKMVGKWHPDKFPNDEVKKKEAGIRMEQINRAYYCIGDDDRRRRYDQFGEQGVGTSAASEDQLRDAGGPGFGFGGMGGGSGVDMGDISDIFESFFGGAGGVNGRASGKSGGGTRRDAKSPVAGDLSRLCIFLFIAD